jgi:DNA-directed RNA polymerase subunit H
MDYDVKNLYEQHKMEVLKIMLKQRGVNTDVSETIETTFPAAVTKLDKVFVYMSTRSRISEKDIETVVEFTQKNGGELSIVVVPIAPSATILSIVRQYSDRFQLFHTGQLQFDIRTHRKVPPHRLLTEEEKKVFVEKYHITKPADQLPMIDSQDPMAKWIGAKPGDIVEVMRRSETAGATPYYRYCVADVTL